MPLFVSSTLDFSGEHPHVLFVGSLSDSEPEVISLEQICSSNHELVIFETTGFVNFCRIRKVPVPKSMIDIFQIYKLIQGKPSRLHRYPLSKVVWEIFKNIVQDKDELQIVISDLIQHPNETDEKIFKALKALNRQFKLVYSVLISQLQKKDEFERFHRVEYPFNNILAKRQYAGILVSKELLLKKEQDIVKELNVINKRLRFEYNIFNAKDLNDVKHTLDNNSFKYLAKAATNIKPTSFWSLVKLSSETNELLSLLYKSYRLSHEKMSLAKIIVEVDSKVYPEFDCCGTVTSRALVRNPLIQQLKKTSREIFIPPDGTVHLYADYSQFEPGILASLANDPTLIKCYNDADLYTSLSMELFGKKEFRSVCKIIFLAFMYGMSNVALENLVRSLTPNSDSYESGQLNKFFDKFSSLSLYKSELENVAAHQGKVCTSLGNHRYFNCNTSYLPSKVRRWILSQKVQGTASLILKSAILKCIEDREIDFLIPMHDAALFQIPQNKVLEKKTFIKQCFESSMLEYCNQLKPKVVFKKFSE